MHAFGNKAAQYRDAYLFDLETCALELSQLARGLTPYLASLVCQTSSNVVSGETRPPTMGDIISPLLSKIGRLHALVDNHVHLRQPAGMSVSGHNVFCAHAHHECTRANREILTEVWREADRAAQHSRACHELLSSGLQSFPTTGPPVGTVGGDGFSMSKNARKRYNRQKQQLF